MGVSKPVKSGKQDWGLLFYNLLKPKFVLNWGQVTSGTMNSIQASQLLKDTFFYLPALFESVPGVPAVLARECPLEKGNILRAGTRLPELRLFFL